MFEMIVVLVVGMVVGYSIKKRSDKKALAKWLEEQRKLGKVK